MKTIKVQDLKSKINTLLASPAVNQRITEETKAILCNLLEDILHDTNNYRGYNHVDWNARGYTAWVEAGQPDFPTKNLYIGREYSRLYY